MTDIRTVDARGLSCPQPVMLVRLALQELSKGIIEVLVDAGTARDNVYRLVKSAGWATSIEPQPDGSYRIVLKK